MSDQNSTTPDGLEQRTFEALDAISAHLKTCPRWWFPERGRVLHCREHDALSDAFQAVMVPLINAHRGSVTDVFQLEAEITRFHAEWQRKYEAHRVRAQYAFWRRWRPVGVVKHTPYAPRLVEA